jgi:uncharacterized membrane protein YbhN (UPF0104 family)
MSISVGNLRKKGMVALKIAFSILLLYLVFRQIPFRHVWMAIQESRPGYLVLALLFFVLSKLIAALRLNRYFRHIGIPLTEMSNFKLYLLGMFYNLFLPGGIGGDAYKGYLLNRMYAKPVKSIVAVLLLDRLSGLFALFVLSGGLLLTVDIEVLASYREGILPVLLTACLVYFLAHRRWFPKLQRIFWTALGYSALVQIAQLFAAYFILSALGMQQAPFPYLLLFLCSSVVAVVPITIGGVGSRELVFYYGALWWKLEEPTVLALSLIFFAITALISLCGIPYHFRKPQLQLRHLAREAG